MRLAIVHYHLRRGGVTRVIANALEALGDTGREAVVLSSTESEEPLPCKVAVVPGLAYCDSASGNAVDELHKGMLKAAEAALGGPPDLWHIHNHGLGKNVNFPPMLRRLLEEGHRALLQIHDFAEDGRPGNYARQLQPFRDGVFKDYDRSVYPLAPQVAYAVLNGRDRAILERAGIPSSSIHWLPNAVTVPEREDKPRMKCTDKPLILYPTRGIRRKNIGEVLLLAQLHPEVRFGTTLAPENPQWFKYYDGWTRLNEELQTGVEFGLGEGADVNFGELVASASAMLTTSVGEGFGLAYLEPWLFGKGLCGRDLPGITADFKENGIQLPDLYAELPVPCSSFDSNAQRGRYAAALATTYAAYGQGLDGIRIDAAWEQITSGGTIDFGQLDELAQAEVIRHAVAHPGRIHSPLPDLPGRMDDPVMEENAALIRTAYGLPHYGQLLRQIYASVGEAPAAEIAGLPHRNVLQAFLDVRCFNLLRT
jgi:glycosyltransferase involved in cell wall biosynthesis